MTAQAVISLVEAIWSLLLLAGESLSLAAVRTDAVNTSSSGTDVIECDLAVSTGLTDRDLDLAVNTGLGDLDLTSVSSSISRTRDLLDLGVSDRGVTERMERSGAAAATGEAARDELCSES